MGVLPVALFASGHTFFVQRLHERLGLPVVAVHATFQFSGTPGKRHRLRERQLWLAVRLSLQHGHATARIRPRRATLSGLPQMAHMASISPVAQRVGAHALASFCGGKEQGWGHALRRGWLRASRAPPTGWA